MTSVEGMCVLPPCFQEPIAHRRCLGLVSLRTRLRFFCMLQYRFLLYRFLLLPAKPPVSFFSCEREEVRFLVVLYLLMV